MTTPAALHLAAFAVVDALTTVTAYYGDVPAHPPADASGRVYPYCVLWSGPGGAPAETAVHDTSTGLDWAVQVTVAAGDVTWCLQAVTVVRAALAGLVLVPGAGPLVDETPRSQPVMRDPDVAPPRWFVPLFFGCLTA